MGSIHSGVAAFSVLRIHSDRVCLLAFAALSNVHGTYHHVSPQHLHRYLSEFDFRYSNRKITDGERSCRLIGKVSGKRLMYRDLVPKD
jgi:hypothetical protein